MSRDDLENLLRNHLGGELDSQRGRAARAFAQQVVEPMHIGLENRRRQWHKTRLWSTAGTAMAACVMIGYFVPRMLTSAMPIETADVISVGTTKAPFAVQTVSMEHTRDQTNVDLGPAMIDANTPGRKIVRQQVERWRWDDPNTGGRFDVVEPSESNYLLEVHRQ